MKTNDLLLILGMAGLGIIVALWLYRPKGKERLSRSTHSGLLRAGLVSPRRGYRYDPGEVRGNKEDWIY